MLENINISKKWEMCNEYNHGSHVGGQEKISLSFGNWTPFSYKLSKFIFLLYWQPTCYVVANQEVLTLQSLCRVVANQTMSGHGDEVRPS